MLVCPTHKAYEKHKGMTFECRRQTKTGSMCRAPCEEYGEAVWCMGRARVVQLLQIQIKQAQSYSSIVSPGENYGKTKFRRTICTLSSKFHGCP